MAIKASNQITITDITDAYSVFIDNENYSFIADDDQGSVSGSFASNIKVYCGNSAQAFTIGTIKFYQGGTEIPSADLKFSATATTGSVTTATVTVQAGTGAAITSPIEVRVPITIGSGSDAIEFNKSITMSLSPIGPGGAAGKGITSVTRYFQRTNTNSAPSKNATGNPGSSWSTTMTAPDGTHHYLWATDHYEYTDSSSANGTVILASQYNDANKWYSGTAITGTSTTAQVFSGSGITNAVINDHYLNTSTGNTYICTLGGNASTAKWKYDGNIKGAAGADAILLEISANGPTVFKKNTDNVTLTPVVRVGGTALTINVGTTSSPAYVTIGNTNYYVRWYDGNTEKTKASVANSIVAVKDSNSKYTGSLQIYGAYVTNAALLECRLDESAS